MVVVVSFVRLGWSARRLLFGLAVLRFELVVVMRSLGFSEGVDDGEKRQLENVIDGVARLLPNGSGGGGTGKGPRFADRARASFCVSTLSARAVEFKSSSLHRSAKVVRVLSRSYLQFACFANKSWSFL